MNARQALTVAEVLRGRPDLVPGDVESMLRRLRRDGFDYHLDKSPLSLLAAEWEALLGGIVPPGERWRDRADQLRAALVEADSASSGFRNSRRILTIPASAIPPRAVEWVWDDRIPAGGITLLAGKGGLGKSTLALHLAAQLSRGTLPGRHQGRPAVVLYATAEDAWSQVMVPRLMAARADLARVRSVALDESVAGFVDTISLPEDLDSLADVVQELDACLLVVDPLVAFVSDKVDSHRDHQIRRALGPLHKLAETHDLAVIGVVHLNKRESRAAADRILGSVGFYNTARSALLLTEASGGSDFRLLTNPKANLGKPAVTLRYRIEGFDTWDDGQQIRTSRVVLVGQAPDIAFDEGLAMLDDSSGQTARGDACSFLETALSKGPVPSKLLLEMAGEEGIADSTLRRAKKSIGAKAKRDGPNGEWRWHPRTQDVAAGHEGHVGHLGHVDEVPAQDEQDGQGDVSRTEGEHTETGRRLGSSSDWSVEAEDGSSASSWDPVFSLLLDAFGDIEVLDEADAEAHFQGLAARQSNYSEYRPPGVPGSDLCRCGRGMKTDSPDGFPYCHICGPPETNPKAPASRHPRDGGQEADMQQLDLWQEPTT
ncbi:MAG: AAA family ATPase [Acidimicrobiia bacterium]|nr:AAA family ATPase [Acidimicrobiia bacterium]